MYDHPYRSWYFQRNGYGPFRRIRPNKYNFGESWNRNIPNVYSGYQTNPYNSNQNLVYPYQSFQAAYQTQTQMPYQMPYQTPFQAPYQHPNQMPYQTPYPKPFFKPQSSGFQSMLTQFKNSDGKLDFDKMFNTAGQMMGAVNQLGSVVKGVSSIFKV